MTYKVYLTAKINPKTLKKGSGIIVLEPEDYTIDQIKVIKAKGYKVLAYLSIGTIEKERIRDAMLRHCLRYIEDPGGKDEESGLSHLAHLATNVAFLIEMEDGKG